MQLSKRMTSLPASPTVTLNSKAKAMAAAGVEVVNFSVGEPDYPTPSSIVASAISSLKEGNTRYGAAGGGEEIRKAISEKLNRENQLNFAPDQIVVGMGAKEILLHISMAILNEGDEVIIPAPYWVSYPAHCHAVGAVPVILPFDDKNQRPQVSPETIEKLASPRTRAIVLNSPNNPGGYVFDQEQLNSLASYLKTKNWWILSDEIYEYLSFDHPHVSILRDHPELRDRTIVVNGLSKGFAMTGWRVGYACAPLAAAKLIRTLQSQSSTCLPPFIEDAATFAIHQGREIMTQEIQLMKDRRNWVVSYLSEKLPTLRWISPQGAFYIFLDIRTLLQKPESSIQSSLAFSEALLENYQVAMVPGEAFGVPGYLRLSYAADTSTLKRGLDQLVRMIHEME